MRGVWRWVVVVGACAPLLGGCRDSKLPILGTQSGTDGVPLPDAAAPPAADACASTTDCATRPPDGGTSDAGGSVALGFPSGLCLTAAPFRLLSPLSGSTVTTARPALRVETAGGAADVQVCRDRACATVAWQTRVACGAAAAPASDLPAGYWFWRARPVAGDDSPWTPAWEFRVRAHRPPDAPVANTAAEPFEDFNGDGYPDVLLAQAIVFGGPSSPTVQPDDAVPVMVSVAQPAVDMNGDGFTDFASLFRTPEFQPLGNVLLGSAQGLVSTANQVTLFPGRYPLSVDEAPIGVGDVDGDGYGDMVWSRRYGGYLIRGCSGGAAAGPWAFLSSESESGRSTLTGDVNGDGLWDVVYIADQQAVLYPGTTGTPRGALLGSAQRGLMFDLNGDGYSDLVAYDGSGSPQVFFGGAAGLTSAGGNADLPIGIDGFGDFDGDGYMDLVSWTIGNLRYGGVPPFAPGAHSAPVPVAQAGAVVDLNGDGVDDLLLAAGGVFWDLYLGSPSGLATSPIVLSVP